MRLSVIGRCGRGALAPDQNRVQIVRGATIALALLLVPEAPATTIEPGRLNLSMTITSGEHSRDSNSTTTSITLNGKQVHYGRTYAGYRASRRAAVDKNVEIREEDLDRIQEVLAENDLLRSRSSISPTNKPGSYVEIDATITSPRRKAILKFSGMRENAGRDNLYVGLEALLSEIEQMVNP
jgi:hypothetical protein